MFYHKCENCQSEWKGIKLLEVCPFCNTGIINKTGNFTKIEEALSYIFNMHGIEVVNEDHRFVALLSDYAPTLESERRLIKIALRSGVYSELLKVSISDYEAQKAAKNKAVTYLNKRDFLDPVWAEAVVMWLITQLNWVSCDKQERVSTSKDSTAGNNITVSASPVRNKSLRTGDIVYFGKYPYREDKTLKKIEWEVLDIKDEKALLWSTMCLDSYYYHHERIKCKWRDCDLRKWLQEDFIYTAFTKEEIAAIVVEPLPISYNPRTKIGNGDVGTNDRVFILSNEQVVFYRIHTSHLISKATPYAKKQGVFCDPVDLTAFWWLRTPGLCGKETEMFVSKTGQVDKSGNFVDQKGRGIRPAVWVNLKVLNNLSK